MAEMKIMVTGGAGFIGSNVVDAYLALGHDVIVADDLSTGKRANVNPAATLREVDIASPEFIALVTRERPDVLNHHAAQTSVRVSVDDPLNDCRRNILGSLNVIDAAQRAGVSKLIYISSGGAIYGEPTTLPCDEEHQIRPDSPYGASKHAPEHYLDIYQRLHGLRYTALRYGNVYGPRQDPFGEAGVIAIFTARMLAGESVTINGNGEQERDFVFVGDVVRANVAALERADNTAVNIGAGVGTSVNEIYAQLRDATGYQLPATYGPPRPGETFRIYLNIQRAAQLLDWTPQVSLADGLAQTVASLRLNSSASGLVRRD
jgi:UDP-glucose 4-epimerase